MQGSVTDQVSNALALAKSAVEADSRRDHETAIRKYRETIQAIERALDRISQDGARSLLTEKLNAYRQRLGVLEKAVPSSGGNVTSPAPAPATSPFPARGGSTVPAVSRPPIRVPPSSAPVTTTPTTPIASPPPSGPTWVRTTSAGTPPLAASHGGAIGPNVFFIEEEINPALARELSTPPDSPNQRTFWLIHLLHQTMTKGGFLTPKLYVSQSVWDQKGAKFSAVQTKISGLQSVLEALCKMANVDVNNSDECFRQLEDFCGVLTGVQNLLAKHLSFVKESKDEKKGILKSVGTGMARLKTGLSSASTDDGYVVVLRETLAKTSIFDKWLARYENGTNNKQVWELLSRVCDFFYSVVIAFVIRDFNMLLVRYIKRSNESFFEE